ncbi:hypothetical protein CMQ_1835 [Grosmannia clavigera kw1407]|uniref:DUF3835 domain-containing protein n=1 Tax=Grosmannia clavigera (strain kw1407 / UAMH 11150) TaxID=655863 RepID=F0XN28_GROCL|nr:uncharacterized protein CMQ_1835 [Grosmannia clavigera kw1407]EFX00754.1 hypothetical protein CMQ_1835 [Grosmannia clavigera kw1407]
MTTIRDSVSDLERHTQLLEASVAKLTQALGHWQLLEAEYEALSEEVAEATRTSDDDGDSEDDGDADATLSHEQQTRLAHVCRDFDGQLVDQKTVSEIVGAQPGQSITKKPGQIRGLIGRRLDYVRQNASALQKQVEREANRLAAAQVISRPDMIGDEESGEPITDIVEELDEEGNVLNVRLQTPSNTESRVLETLKKAGINELPEGGPEEEDQKKNQKSVEKEPSSASAMKIVAAPASAPKDGKKGVSFADDTKPGHDEPSSETSQPQMSRTAQRLDEIIRAAKEQESMISTATSVAPIDELEADAALRREMLEYSMSEIGPIVAQLDIEEVSSGEEDDEGYDDEYDDDDDDEEDGHGRSKYSAIDEAYRERMRELERKLGVARQEKEASSMAVDTNSEENDFDEGIGRIRVSGLTAAPLSGSVPSTGSSLKDKSKESGEKKKVSFANALDISPADVAPAAEKLEAVNAKDVVPVVEPLGDVIERQSSNSKPTVGALEPAVAKKPSRFKMARGTTVASPQVPQLPQGPHQAPARFLDLDRRVTPEGPEGKTLAEAVVERQPTAEAREPDELDPALLMQEAATEYHRSRNRLIQRQGGFTHANQSAVVPLDEDEGGHKRVSRFKAARLAKQ